LFGTFFNRRAPVVSRSQPEKVRFQRNGVTYTGYVDSKRAVGRFCQFGVTPNKSDIGLYPIVPREVWWHYFRGILDGDGNINFSRTSGLRITIAGNRNCVLGLQSDLNEMFVVCSTARYLDEDRVKLLELRGGHAEKALTLLYQDSEDLRLERKYNQWLEWNQHFKLTTNCLLCDVSLRASKGEKLCPSCRVIRNRLMNRRSDHYRRKGVWMSLRDLCKPEENHLPVERLDLYLESSAFAARLYGQRRAKRKTEAIVKQLQEAED
jgi:hypothetical protein